jgi:hypothetical protein
MIMVCPQNSKHERRLLIVHLRRDLGRVHHGAEDLWHRHQSDLADMNQGLSPLFILSTYVSDIVTTSARYERSVLSPCTSKQWEFVVSLVANASASVSPIYYITFTPGM